MSILPTVTRLSHYSVNSRVMHGNFALRREDVKDGLSNTIMGGEVNANFRPWGDPVNWRDPAVGLGKSPDGFGGPWKSGVTQFLFMDGSVRALSNDIDPQVLKALSTPAGGEDVHEFIEKNNVGPACRAGHPKSCSKGRTYGRRIRRCGGPSVFLPPER